MTHHVTSVHSLVQGLAQDVVQVYQCIGPLIEYNKRKCHSLISTQHGKTCLSCLSLHWKETEICISNLRWPIQAVSDMCAQLAVQTNVLQVTSPIHTSSGKPPVSRSGSNGSADNWLEQLWNRSWRYTCNAKLAAVGDWEHLLPRPSEMKYMAWKVPGNLPQFLFAKGDAEYRNYHPSTFHANSPFHGFK